MERTTNIEDVFNLGTWLGRKQALGLIAGRCTAAELECLMEVYEKKLYLALEHTWEDYCRKRLGIGRRTADRLIRNYRAQGPLVARLNCFTRIQPREYRLFAAILSEEGLLFDGEIIPLEPANAPRIADAVDAVRQQSAVEAPPPDPARRFARAQRYLEHALNEMAALRAMELEEALRREVSDALARSHDLLGGMRSEAA